jgi:hypothetical protein
MPPPHDSPSGARPAAVRRGDQLLCDHTPCSPSAEQLGARPAVVCRGEELLCTRRPHTRRRWVLRLHPPQDSPSPRSAAPPPGQDPAPAISMHAVGEGGSLCSARPNWGGGPLGWVPGCLVWRGVCGGEVGVGAQLDAPPASGEEEEELLPR